jgi:putative heme iron utilization protein|tara:strand:+ start:5211 stop:5414 length:204 start_codon:yes stop_codon:yes gene_type:complete
MDYQKQHLRAWLMERPLIKVEALEEQAGCSKGTIRHLLKDRRNISANHLDSIGEILSIYGYIPLVDE